MADKVKTLSKETKHLESGLATPDQLHDLTLNSPNFKQLTQTINKLSRLNIPDMPRGDPYRVLKTHSAEEVNNYQSAGILLSRLAKSIAEWRTDLPESVQPLIIAILQGGVQIEIERLEQESFHGIRIEGKLQGAPCVVLAHQATVQLLCIAQQVDPSDTPKRPIGFVINGEELEA